MIIALGGLFEITKISSLNVSSVETSNHCTLLFTPGSILSHIEYIIGILGKQ